MDELQSLTVDDNLHQNDNQLSTKVKGDDDQDEENFLPSEIPPEKQILELPQNLPYGKEKIAEIQDWFFSSQRTWKSRLQKYRKIKSKSSFYKIVNLDLDRIRDATKVINLSKELWRIFDQKRSSNSIIHDRDLRIWAKSIASNLDMNWFRCSEHFLYNWKKKYRVSSRKVIEYQTQSTQNNEVDILNQIEEYRKLINDKLSNDIILLNSDESGCSYDMVQNRTLSFNGEKKTFAMCSSMSNVTHSYTIQPRNQSSLVRRTI
ncbi:hypothetical protein SNEBB_002975 [Seison nebaliae]|nr:hypothetical protein SNEBB_002975 [Seison nebaliae]